MSENKNAVLILTPKPYFGKNFKSFGTGKLLKTTNAPKNATRIDLCHAEGKGARARRIEASKRLAENHKKKCDIQGMISL